MSDALTARAATMTPVRAARLDWIDATRGGCIVLVVVLHALVAYQLNGPADTIPVLTPLMIALSEVRMPLLFLLSGCLLHLALRKAPLAYVVGNVQTLAWPFVLWAPLINGDLREAAASIQSALGGDIAVISGWPGAIAHSVLGDQEIRWFLGNLFVLYLVALATRRVRPVHLAGACYAGAVACTWFGADAGLTKFLLLAAFFFIGSALFQERSQRLLSLPVPWAVALVAGSTAAVKRAYGDWTGDSMKGWKAKLNRHAITPEQTFAYTTGKNSTDSALIIDAMDLLYSDNVDAFAIVSSDSDFTRLATRLRESGKTVYAVGHSKTPIALQEACDQFIRIELLTPAPDESAREADAAENPDEAPAAPNLQSLLTRGINNASDEDGWVSLSGLGNYLRTANASFDPRLYGFTKLLDLVKDQAFLTTTGTGSGVRVGVKGRAAATAPAKKAPAKKAPAKRASTKKPAGA